MSIALNNCKSEATHQLSDAELVRAATDGDTGAFDLLVLRHRSTVLNAARAGVNDWEQAEDVAQQALVEAYKCLCGLRDGASFRAWLVTITKRCASRCRASQPDEIELSEAVMCSYVAPTTFSGLDEVTENVRVSLSELSARSRRIVTLYYLDGYSSREIGSSLGLPEGTVRRILHESRNSLRSRMGIAKGDMRSMDKPTTKTGPRGLVFWINGNWPGPVMNTLMAQSVCLAVNKTPKTVAQMAKQIDANARFVEEALDSLVCEELVMKSPGGKYATNFIALDAEDWIQVTTETRAHAAKLADAFETHLPVLKEAWEKTSLPARGFPWAESIWTMLAIFVGNQGVSRNGVPETQPPTHAGSGKVYWPGGREVVSDEHVMWCTGFSSSGPTKAGPSFRYGYFWTHGLDRSHADWNEDRSRVWAAIACGAESLESIAEIAELPLERVRENVARSIEFGLIERLDDKLRLTFPVFGREESDTLCPTVDSVASQICDAIISPATENVTDMLRDLGYARLEEHFSPWRRWLEGDIVGESLRELLRRGVLPDPGECAPVTFAMVGWIDDPRLLSWSR